MNKLRCGIGLFRKFVIMAKHKYIETPEILWDHFLQYKKLVKNSPILVKDWVGKDADQVYKEKEKPLTVEGFENYLEDNDIIGGLGDYFSNKGNAYDLYSTICSRIKRNIRQDQIEGGMVGIYNPSITQRINNLKESTDITSGGDKIQTAPSAINVRIIENNDEE